MRVRNKLGLFIGVTFSFLFVTMSFQNCAPQTDFSSLDSSSTGDDNTGTSLPSKVDPGIDGAPTDAKQTLESMMSLVGLAPQELSAAALTEVNSEINYRRNLLVPQNDIRLITSPTIIAMTSVAAVVCKHVVAKEKAAAKADLFKYLDFKKGPSGYGKNGALNTYINMANRFWMRKPTSDELTLMSQTVDEYYSTLDSAAMGKAAETDKLAIYICTGMLSIPESYLL